MTVLSVDLASRSWNDLGLVLLERVTAENQQNFATPHGRGLSQAFPQPVQPTADFDLTESQMQDQSLTGLQTLATSSFSLTRSLSVPPVGSIACEIFTWQDESGTDSPTTADVAINPEVLAGRLNRLAQDRGVHMILLDGPQAWKSASNGCDYARVSERQLNTSAKTGLPGMVKPITYRAFADFCVDVFDALGRRGWKRLETREEPIKATDNILIESYPHAAWKSLGLKPLASKRRHKVSDLAEAMAALKTVVPVVVNRPPNHDQLQAIVGGLAGLALTERKAGAWTKSSTEQSANQDANLGALIYGQPPRREEGHWREGFIALPVAPQPSRVQWMN